MIFMDIAPKNKRDIFKITDDLGFSSYLKRNLDRAKKIGKW